MVKFLKMFTIKNEISLLSTVALKFPVFLFRKLYIENTLIDYIATSTNKTKNPNTLPVQNIKVKEIGEKRNF